MKTVIIGGTGRIGSKLVAKLREHGNEAVPASPDTGVDTVTGKGLAEVLEGAEVVVDVSNSPSFADQVALEFFTKSTSNLLAGEKVADVRHHLALSVVGTDRLGESGYFRAKQAQERLIQTSSLPYTIVHATQFFEFIGAMADDATEGNTVRLPPVMIQPMAADDVASGLARAAVGPPRNRIVEIAGPEEFRLDELVRRYLEERNDPRDVSTDPNARYFGIRLEERTLLPGSEATLGQTRFEDWMSASSDRPAPRGPSPRAVGSAPAASVGRRRRSESARPTHS